MQTCQEPGMLAQGVASTEKWLLLQCAMGYGLLLLTPTKKFSRESLLSSAFQVSNADNAYSL